MSGSSLVLPTRNGLEVDLDSGFVLLRALKHVAEKAGNAALGADDLLRLLLGALASDARDESGQHASLGNIEALLLQLRRVGDDPGAMLRQQILAFPQIQRIYRRLSELQGDPPWIFRAASDGKVRLLSLRDVVGNASVELKWDTQSRTSGSSSTSTFELNAKAGAGLNLDVQSSSEANEELSLSPAIPANEVAVVVSASGAISAGLSAGVSAPLTAKMGGSLYAETRLSYLYQIEQDQTVISALDRMRGDLPSPFGLQSIYTRLDPPTVGGLRRVEFAIGRGGAMSLALSLERATSVTSTFDGPSEVISASQLLAASASVSFSVGKDITRSVTLEKSTDGRLCLSSRVSRESSADLQAGLSIGVAIDGLDDWAKAWLGTVLPAVPDSLKEALTEFANPGQRLAGAIESRLSNPVAKKLALLLVGQASADEVAAAISERVLAPIRRAFDSVENLFDAASDAPAEVLGRVVDAIQRASGEAVAGDELQALLAQPVVDAWSEVIAALRERVAQVWANEIEGRTRQQIARLIDPLTDSLGVTAAVSKTEDLVGLAQAYLKRYGEWRAGLFAELERSLSGRIGFAVSYGRKDVIESWLSRRYEIDLSSLGAAGWKSAEAQYRRLLVGGIGDQGNFGGAPTVVFTELEAAGSTARSVVATLDLLPFQAVFSAKRIAKAQLFASPTGEIRSASGELENSESASSRKRAWTVRFSGTLNLADARLKGGVSALPMGIELTAAFAQIDSSGVQELFASLAVANAIGAVPLFDIEALDALAARLKLQSGVNKEQAVKLSFGVMFPSDGLERFIDALEDSDWKQRSSELLLASRRRIVTSGMDDAIAVAKKLLTKAMRRDAATYDLFPAFASQRGSGDSLPRLKIDSDDSPEIRAGSLPGESLGHRNSPLARGAWQLEKSLRAWGGLQDFAQAIARLRGAVTNASQAIAAARTDSGKVKAAETGISELLKIQAEANSQLGWTLDPSDSASPSESVAPDTVALLALVAEIFGSNQLQRPNNSMRVWVGKRSKALKDVSWTEIGV